MTARVVIVGAGPAGIRAAEALVGAGLHPVVLDEGERAGGQIYRRPPAGFTRSPAKLYGSEAGRAVALHRLFDRMAADGRLTHRPRTSAIAVRTNTAGGTLQLHGPDGVGEVGFDRLIVATGASDRVLPVLGWEAPGVYSLGAAQIALKAQGVALGRRIVLAGSGPLLTLVASQLVKAGAEVAAVLDTSPLATQLSGLREMAARPGLTARGAAMRLRLGRRYHAGATLDEIVASPEGPVAMLWRDAKGRPQRTTCDAVALGWHLRAETHLAELAGCGFDYSDTWAQWLPRADPQGRAEDRLYLAGDGLRLLGADGAELSGRLAGLACLADLGLPAADPAPDLKRLARMLRFARGLAHAFPWPAAALRALPDATCLCRCEAITAGALREAADYGGAEANRAKSLSRVGMGRCQGRYCALAAAEIVASHAGTAVPEVGRLRAQAPVRPCPIGAAAQD
ncbi:MAG TPA: FAD/NAD(P)-binding oxidoreductase [Amaricoccus sp.]|nr:FAD/NAD(P)-binding oxidoreductase [Amaricoccus sp.]